MSILTKEKLISVEDLKKAISLKCSICYGAMAFANALGGTETDAWYLCHSYTLKQLLEEAKEQNVDLSALKTCVEVQPVCDSLYYKRAASVITDEEFNREFRKWQQGK